MVFIFHPIKILNMVKVGMISMWIRSQLKVIAGLGDYEKAKRFVDKANLERFMRGKKGEFWDGAEIVIE